MRISSSFRGHVGRGRRGELDGSDAGALVRAAQWVPLQGPTLPTSSSSAPNGVRYVLSTGSDCWQSMRTVPGKP
eukprot:4971019-Prymnesium_polylepis.1